MQCHYGVVMSGRDDYEHPISFLDGDSMRSMYRSFRDFAMRIIGQTGRRTRGTFLQDTDTKFPCNISGMRSETIPNSVHRLKPGKIKLIHIHFDLVPQLLAATLIGKNNCLPCVHIKTNA